MHIKRASVWERVVEKPQILIVEDDLDLSEMLNAYFRVQNYDVLTAAWGEEALRITRDTRVELVVLDIRLPDIDGYEVCRRLRSQRSTQDTPIIFLTEKRDRVDKLHGLELGVVDYITKPFDIQELRLRVRNALNRVSRHSMINSVTDLPEGEMIDERLNALLNSSNRWAVLMVGIASLSEFREMYGFVAADDVLRAITLMVRNAVREFGAEEDFIGHLSAETFIVITQHDRVGRIRERVETRIAQSREYFYPLRDRDKVREAMEANHLRIISNVLEQGGNYADIEAFKTLLIKTAVDR
jgi:PleD family two-component response regulator